MFNTSSDFSEESQWRIVNIVLMNSVCKIKVWNELISKVECI